MANLIQCGPGNKRCGKRCIPQSQTCRLDEIKDTGQFRQRQQILPLVKIATAIGVGLVVNEITKAGQRQLGEPKPQVMRLS